MDKDKLEKDHNCDNINCNHNDTKGLCCLFNPDNCKYRQLQKENAELKEKLNRYKHDCPNCSAFGKHCPHRVNGDPYTYDCYLTVADLEKENAELQAQIEKMKCCFNCKHSRTEYEHCRTDKHEKWEIKEK